jgi:hypothetical protein
MEENYTSLDKFDISPSINDLFWEEKIKRTIEECNSISELKKIAILLARIATQRQGVILGLVKDIKVFNGMSINPNEITNPEIKT